MVEPEPREALSSRKLVVETAKFNVTTAHSGKEASELLREFPKVSALVLHSDIRDVPAAELIRQAKEAHPGLPVIFLGTHFGSGSGEVDRRIPSQDPEMLVAVLREILGDPRILKQEESTASR